MSSNLTMNVDDNKVVLPGAKRLCRDASTDTEGEGEMVESVPVCTDASTDTAGEGREAVDTVSVVVSGRLDALTTKIDEVSKLLAGLVTAVGEISTTLTDIKEKVNQHDISLSQLKGNVSQHETSLRKLHDKTNLQAQEMKEVTDDLKKCKERLRKMEERGIDQEARSRRNNLLFYGIDESADENTTTVLQKFITNDCKIKDGKDLLIQRVHRLGDPNARSTIGKKTNRPRAIIASFVDYRQKEQVRRTKFNLNPKYSISEDFPIEIRKARDQLQPELRELKKQKKRATIIYPARLLVDGKVVREVRPSAFSTGMN